MKKYIILFLIIVSPFVSFRKTSMSCTYKEICNWNQYSEKWDQDCPGEEAASLFVMNDSETMFTHTTLDIKSTYYVTSKESGEDGLFTYYVTSDVGNKYYAIFDLANEEIKFINTKSEDQNDWYMVRWYVKALF
jgi:hypothetical protein